MKKYDAEGDDIITACACARILHDADGPVARKLQAALARLCNCYGFRRPLSEGSDRKAFMTRMVTSIVVREAEINREVNG